MLQDWQQRVVDERAELNEKCTKLFDFLRSERIPVTGEDRRLLSIQLEVMIRYRDILDERIERFQS